MDVPKLVDWLSSRQYAPEGGFAGRTNKLVDGCYSQWIGGCWPLVEAALEGVPESKRILAGDSLYSREALTRYILCCGQDTSKRGGLRDKPGMYETNPSFIFASRSHADTRLRFSDGYHTCYLLAGLSSAQHKWTFHVPEDHSTPSLGWSSEKYPTKEDEGYVQVFDEEDRVNPLHPVYVIPEGAAENMMEYCDNQERFQ